MMSSGGWAHTLISVLTATKTRKPKETKPRQVALVRFFRAFVAPRSTLGGRLPGVFALLDY